jgi:hypothetical protein
MLSAGSLIPSLSCFCIRLPDTLHLGSTEKKGKNLNGGFVSEDTRQQGSQVSWQAPSRVCSIKFNAKTR